MSTFFKINNSILVFLFVASVPLAFCSEAGISINLMYGNAVPGDGWNVSSYDVFGSETNPDFIEHIKYEGSYIYGLGLDRFIAFENGYRLTFGFEALQFYLDRIYSYDLPNNSYTIVLNNYYENYAVHFVVNNQYYFHQLSSGKFIPYAGFGVLAGIGYEHTESFTANTGEGNHKEASDYENNTRVAIHNDESIYALRPEIGISYKAGEDHAFTMSFQYRYDLTDAPLSSYSVSFGYLWITH